MRRTLSLAAVLKPLARWREEARARVERDAAFEAWLVNSGLHPHPALSADQQERDTRQKRSSA
ncbi:hypothetical protein C3942_10105 [Solimonas fluminis]|uniref:Uncharacterized protein n=1 Tax=Solimonas fluminis TaxID=2086571 RepID=A0A2S5THE1_9GAMM|nr:hypothetical protein C3942_10105 [Solimonas fluminis]